MKLIAAMLMTPIYFGCFIMGIVYSILGALVDTVCDAEGERRE